MAQLQRRFIAAGCNRSSQALAWGPNDLIAYAAHHAVALYNPQACRVTSSLLGHEAPVQCLAWMPLGSSDGPQYLASGDGAGQVRIWRVDSTSTACVTVLQVASSPLSSLATARVQQGLLLVATSADPGMAWAWVDLIPGPGGCWEIPDDVKPLVRRDTAPKRPMAHAAALHHHEQSGTVLLALGTVDSAVELHVAPVSALAQPQTGDGFTQAARLTGHVDWVRGLAWVAKPDGCLLLASASQDRFIRVWAVTPQHMEACNHAAAVTPLADASFSSAAAPGITSVEALLTRLAPKPTIALADGSCMVATLEALLVGHEDWVLSVAWKPGPVEQAPMLLSASMDRGMMMWQADASGLWLSRAALGDAGANHLGYYSCAWAPDGQAVATHGYTGSLHIWHAAADGGWEPVPAPSGHTSGVVDLAWAGACLLTVAGDQTARCWARCRDGSGGWREVARPQVHGHDFHGLAVLRPASEHAQNDSGVKDDHAIGNGDAARTRRETQTSTPEYCYASCSEEKVVRVFVAPKAFTASLRSLGCNGDDCGGDSGADDVVDDSSVPDGAGRAGLDSLNEALGAMLPALGLSNKAVYDDSDDHRAQTERDAADRAGAGPGSYATGPDFAPAAAPRTLRSVPLEEALSQSTLWPEARKLYGHGSEVATLAAHPSGRWLASAALSSGGTARSAAIWVWDAWGGFAAAQPPLEAHTLTVTRLAFSPDGDLLASVSRDRTLALWQLGDTQAAGTDTNATTLHPSSQTSAPPCQQPFKAVTRIKAGTRVLYDVAWSPDGSSLATASRDGEVAVWAVQRDASDTTALRKLYDCKQGCPVRAVAFAPAASDGMLVVGLEDGRLRLICCDDAGMHVKHEVAAHAGPVQRLAWRDNKDGTFLLASCSLDGAVCIWALGSEL